MCKEAERNKDTKMLGNFNLKLDKGTCLITLGIFSLVIGLIIVTPNVMSLFDMSGVFKQ